MILIRKINPEDRQKFISWRNADIHINNVLLRQVMEHEEGKRVIFIALLNSTIVGTVQFVLQHDDSELADGNFTAYLQSLFVDKNYRRQGIASSLIKIVEFEAIQRNFQRLTIMVESDNYPALNLYQKMGFSFFKDSTNLCQGKQYFVNCLHKNLV